MEASRQIPSGGRQGSAGPGLDRDRLDRLATDLADRFSLLYDVCPTAPRARLDGSVLTFTFRGGLSRFDEWMLGAGHADQIREFREHFLAAVSGQLAAGVEAQSGARVRRFFAAFDPGARTTECYFVLA